MEKVLNKTKKSAPNMINTALLGIVIFFAQQNISDNKVRFDRIESKVDTQSQDISQIKGFLRINTSQLQPLLNLTRLEINENLNP